MRIPLLLVLSVVVGLAASGAHARPAGPDEAGWNQELHGIMGQVLDSKAESLPAVQAAPPAAEPISAPCTEYGKHEEKIPAWRLPPLENTCKDDPLKDEAAVKAAFDRLVAKIRAEDGREPVPARDPFGGSHYELAIGRGNVKWETLDFARHWGDVAVLHLRKKPDGSFEPLGGRLATARANRMRGADIDARRVEFDMGPNGELRAAHIFSGLRMAEFNRMSWLGPTDSPNRDQDLRGWWTIRYHQLLVSWAGAK